MNTIRKFEEEIKEMPNNLSPEKTKKLYNHLIYCYKITNKEVDVLFKYYHKDIELGVSLENSTARTLLIMLNRGLIQRVLMNIKVFNEDAYSDAKLGLIKAIDTYIPSKAKFSTYAYVVIRKEVQKNLRTNNVESLDEYLDDSVLKEYGLLKNFRYNDDFLEQKIEEGVKLSDFIKSEEDLDSKIHSQELSEEVQLCLRQLKPIHQYVLLALHGYYKPKMTRIEISNILYYNRTGLRSLIREAEVLFMMNFKRINSPEEKFRMGYSMPLMTKEEFETFPQNILDYQDKYVIYDRRMKYKYYKYCQKQNQKQEGTTI